MLFKYVEIQVLQAEYPNILDQIIRNNILNLVGYISVLQCSKLMSTTLDVIKTLVPEWSWSILRKGKAEVSV